MPTVARSPMMPHIASISEMSSRTIALCAMPLDSMSRHEQIVGSFAPNFSTYLLAPSLRYSSVPSAHLRRWPSVANVDANDSCALDHANGINPFVMDALSDAMRVLTCSAFISIEM